MLVIIILLFLTFFFSFVFNKSFGKVLPISFISIPLILYLSQFIFKTFKIGTIVIIILSIIGLIITAYKIIKKDKLFLKNIFSKGFYSFIIILIFLYITDYKQQFSTWDELAHWGVMVKEMLRLDKFYSVFESVMVWHKDYPPFISLFEYFWCRILGYSEQTMYLSIHVYLFGLIIPYMVDKLKKNSCIFLFPVLYLMTILLFDSYQIFKTVQADFIISIATLYGFLIIFFEREDSLFKRISLAFCITSLLLTKQIGIPLALMVFTYYILDSIFINKEIVKNKKWFLNTLLILFIPLILFITWNVFITYYKTGAQFSISNINIKEYIKIVFFNEGVEYKLKSFSLFKDYLFSESVMIKPISIGYIPCYIILIIVMTLIYFINKKSFNTKSFWILIILFTCGTIGYAFTMSILYLFCFSEAETITLACFGRYMSTYVLFEYLFVICITIYYMRNKKHFLSKTIALCVIFTIFVGSNLECLLPQKHFGDNYVEFKEVANRINEVTYENSNILIIMEDYSYSYLLQYFLDSRKINQEYPYLYNNINENELNNVVNVILSQDYIYIDDIPNNFETYYGNLFIDQILPKTVYKVNKEIGKLSILK